MGSMPRLELVILGMKWAQAGTPPKTKASHYPRNFTKDQSRMRSEQRMGSHHAVGSDVPMFFGFLQAGEAVALKENFYSSQHLTYKDIIVDNLADPMHMEVNIKQLKTDPFRVGVKVWIGRTRGDLCQVTAVLAYMALCGPEGSYIPLSEQQPTNKTEACLQIAGGTTGG